MYLWPKTLEVPILDPAKYFSTLILTLYYVVLIKLVAFFVDKIQLGYAELTEDLLAFFM